MTPPPGGAGITIIYGNRDAIADFSLCLSQDRQYQYEEINEPCSDLFHPPATFLFRLLIHIAFAEFSSIVQMIRFVHIDPYYFKKVGDGFQSHQTHW